MRKSILTGIEMGCRECEGYNTQCERYNPLDRNVLKVEKEANMYEKAN